MILEAADRHFRDVGFEGFSMAVLANMAGVAKGTLYLYFETREEVLLALYVELLRKWSDLFLSSLSAGIDDEEFAAVFFDSVRSDPAFLTVLARLDSVIEHNVSLENLIVSKRALAAELRRIAGPVADCLGLPTAAVTELLAALGAFLLGASQLDKGPALDDEDVPEDVRRLITAFSPREVFLPNARRILAGIRADMKSESK